MKFTMIKIRPAVKSINLKKRENRRWIIQVRDYFILAIKLVIFPGAVGRV